MRIGHSLSPEAFSCTLLSSRVMRRGWLTLCLVVDLYCLGLLWCSIWPGRLGDALLLTLVISVTVLMVAIPLSIVAAIVWWIRRRTPHRSRRRKRIAGPWLGAYPLKRVAIATAILVLVTQISLTLNLPMRVAFGLSQPAFAAYLDDAPITDQHFSEFPLNERLGLYYVTYYATDSQGGTYFQTGFHGFFPAPHGFAYRPHDQGSPFGHTGHFFKPVAQDWYLFRAGWDW